MKDATMRIILITQTKSDLKNLLQAPTERFSQLMIEGSGAGLTVGHFPLILKE